MNQFISSLVLAAALAAPAMVLASPSPQGVQVRIYDRDHRDYHDWNDREDRAYRSYLVERHRTYIVYGKQHRREQNHYWHWRHEHPDHD
jgi:hypothetical protein